MAKVRLYTFNIRAFSVALVWINIIRSSANDARVKYFLLRCLFPKYID